MEKDLLLLLFEPQDMLIQRNLFGAVIIVILDLFNVEHVLLLLKLSSLILCNEELEVHFLVVVITNSIHLFKLFLVVTKATEATNEVREYGVFEESKDQDNQVSKQEDEHVNRVISLYAEN